MANLYRDVNARALALVKEFESFVGKPYKDPVGLWTVAWGHLIRPGEHFTVVTREEGDDILHADLDAAEGDVLRYIKAPLTDNQFGALVSFAFNVGGGVFARSSIVKLLDGEPYRYDLVPGVLEQYNKAHDRKGRIVTLAGLTRRRKAEVALWNTLAE